MMPVEHHGLGGRLELFDPEQLTDAQRAVYEDCETSVVPWAERLGFSARDEDGHLIGPFNACLLNPAACCAFLAFQRAEAASTSLSPRTREVVILTVGGVWGATYELYAHSAAARETGLADVTAKLLAAGEPPLGLDSEEQLAHRLTHALTVQRALDDELYAEAVETLGAVGIEDLVLLAGSYHLVCMQLNAFAVPSPEKEVR